MSEGYAPYPIITDPATLGLQVHHDRTAFGELWNARRAARFDGPVTLFLHGVGGDWSTWTPLLQELDERGTPLGNEVLVDIPGFGRSENTLGHLDATVVGQELLDWCTSLGATAVHLVGHSMGGFLALDMASRADPRIVGVRVVSGTYLTVVSTYQNQLAALRTKPDTALIFLLMQTLSRLGGLGTKAVQLLAQTPLFAKVMSKTIAHPERVDPTVIRRIADGIRPVAFMQAAANGKHYDCVSAWRRIPAGDSARALFGRYDRLVPPDDYEVVRREVPGVRCEMVEDAGHFAHIEQPALVADWLTGE